METRRRLIIARISFAVVLIVAITVGIVLYTNSGDTPKHDTSTIATRDIYQQPFSRYSPWNMPLGSDAKITPTNLNINGTKVAYQPVSVFLDNKAPSTPLSITGANSSLGDFHIDPTAPSNTTTAESCAAILKDTSDGTTYSEGLNLQTSSVGASLSTISDPNGDGNDMKLNGNGEEGCQTSGLSSLGGLVRTKELADPNAKINHALSIGIECTSSCYASSPPFVWPATKADDGALDQGNSTFYDGTTAALKMGSLLTLDTKFDSTNLSPESAKIAEALKTYGAYITYSIKEPGVSLTVEQGADTKELESSKDQDQLSALFSSLNVVINNSPTNIGGGGTPAACFAPTHFVDGGIDESINPNTNFTPREGCSEDIVPETSSTTTTTQPSFNKDIVFIGDQTATAFTQAIFEPLLKNQGYLTVSLDNSPSRSFLGLSKTSDPTIANNTVANAIKTNSGRIQQSDTIVLQDGYRDWNEGNSPNIDDFISQVRKDVESIHAINSKARVFVTTVFNTTSFADADMVNQRLADEAKFSHFTTLDRTAGIHSTQATCATQYFSPTCGPLIMNNIAMILALPVTNEPSSSPTSDSSLTSTTSRYSTVGTLSTSET